MPLELHCNQLFPDCDGVVRGADQEAVLAQAAAHAADAHGVTQVDAATRDALLAAMQPV
jgi:predicted small metal-binding protein